MKTLIKGIVKSWNLSEGWGFIEGEDGVVYFLHTSKVRAGQSIIINCKVKFDLIQGQRGPEAENVTLY